MTTEMLTSYLERHGDAHNAAEAVMSGFSMATKHRGGQEIARAWLKSLSATRAWPYLLTQSFFRSWLLEVDVELAQLGERVHAGEQDYESDLSSESPSVLSYDCAEEQTIRIHIKSEGDLFKACETALQPLFQWSRAPEQRERFVGGFNAVAASNRSRWIARGKAVDDFSISNPAALGLLHLRIDELAQQSNSFAKQVIEDECFALLGVVLGTEKSVEEGK